MFRKRMFTRYIRAIPCVFLAFVLGTGCSRKSDSPPSTQGAPAKKILTIGNGGEPQEIDPHIVTGVPEHHIMLALFEGLLVPDPKTASPIPGAAESWTNSPDLKTYTFTLRPNAKWSNGDPVTVEDFIKSFQRALTPSLGSEFAYLYYPIVNAEAYHKGSLTNFAEVGLAKLVDRTLQISLNDPTPYFPQLLTHFAFFPVHLPTIEKHGEPYKRGNQWTRPATFVGNGAYRLQEWKVNDSITVEKNPHYWDANRPQIDQVRFLPVESADTEERMFRAGQIDLTQSVPLARIPLLLRESKKDSVLRIDPYLGVYFYRVNVTRPALSDKRVRKALAIAMDRAAITESVLKAGQLPAYNLTPPSMLGYAPPPLISTNIQEAKSLLREAGFESGGNLPKISLSFNTAESHKMIAEVLQEMWRQNLGLSVELQNMEWKVFAASQKDFNFDLAKSTWIADYADPHAFLSLWTSDSGNNRTGWKNKEYDNLLARSGKAADSSERLSLLLQAERLLMDEMPVIPIYFNTRTYLLNPRVKGWHANPLDLHLYQHVTL